MPGSLKIDREGRKDAWALLLITVLEVTGTRRFDFGKGDFLKTALPTIRSSRRGGYAALLLVIASCTATTRAAEILVAAASDLSIAIKEIASEFERKTGHQVKVSLGSSGNFYSQIANGAPFDIFLSADIDYAKKLQDAGLAESGSLFLYGVGRLVVWVPGGSRLDIDHLGAAVLSDRSVKKIAIANPMHAPYGRAAVAALKTLGLYDRVKDKLVLGENISQAAQFVASGAADAGLIALSLALSPAMRQAGRYREISADTYPPLEQGAVILKGAAKRGNRVVVGEFYNWIRSDSTRVVLKRYGFYASTRPGEENH